MNNLVQHVKDHALANYDNGGWDVIVECWDDQDIEERLRDYSVSDTGRAIEIFEPRLSIWADRQADADNAAF